MTAPAVTASSAPPTVGSAAAALARSVVRTPVIRSAGIDRLAGTRLWLKAENLQHTGSYKFRGAMRAVGRLAADGSHCGVIAQSTGNHALAIALAARRYGLDATVVLPEDAAPVKIAGARALGARIVIAGTSLAERLDTVGQLHRSTGDPVIDAYDHPDVIAGQGTATRELLEQVCAMGGRLDAVVVPVGGGGGVAGACLAVRELLGRCGETAVYGVEPVGCDALAQSLRTGELVTVEPAATLADGLRPSAIGRLPFEIVRDRLAGMLTVSDAMIAEALCLALFEAKLLVEPSAAAALAGALALAASGSYADVGVLLTGGNVGAALIARLIAEHGPSRRGTAGARAMSQRQRVDRELDVTTVSGGDKRPRVGILFGGPPGEHEVSCSSALAVVRAIDRDQFEPVVIGITRDLEYRLVPADLVEALREPPVGGRAIDDRLETVGTPVALCPRRPGRGAAAVSAGGDVLAELDVVFPLLHGRFGEDGVLQGVLESLAVPYAGCGVAASSVGMDKVAMKRAFVAEGLPVSPYLWFDEEHWRRGKGRIAGLETLARPLFVKPANMGSSIGISRVAAGDDLAGAVELAFGYDSVVLIEQGVAAPREIECGVLGGFDPQASVVGEVSVAGGWFDYRQKYFGDTDPMIVPADLPAAVAAEVRQLSVRAFRAVGGWGLARVDFLYDDHARRLYLNELNTMPGFTAHSMYPKVWAATGVAYPELVTRLIDLAFERYARRSRSPRSSS